MSAKTLILLLLAVLAAFFLFGRKRHSTGAPAAPAPAQATTRAAGASQPRANHRFIARDEGRTLWFVGEIDGHFYDEFVALARSLPNLQRIDVSSGGGHTEQALYAGEWIRHSGVTVRVVHECDSACVLLWAAAKRRELMVDATLGLHRGWRQGEDGTQQEVELSEMRAYTAMLEHAGFGDIDDWLRTTASTDITALDYSYMIRSNVPFSVVDANGDTTWTASNREGDWDFSIDKAAGRMRFTQ